MASSFLEKMAKKQAEELEKKYGSSAYGGTTWLNNQLTGKKSSTDDDIAPVSTIKKYSETQKAKEEDEERTWFKASDLWDDGYQFGDISKTILGTGEDLAKNIGAGIVGIGEKVVDAFATVAPYVAQGQYYQNGGGFNIQADQAFNSAIAVQKEGTKEFVKKDLYDEKKVADVIIGNTIGLGNKALGIDSEAHSVFGEKSDALAQSGGQLLGQLAANAIAPGSGLALMGVTSFGSEAEGALMNGANLDEAVLSGAISAGAEMLTEKIGGISFGGKTLTDAAFSNLSRHMTSKLAKVLITTGKVTTDALAEGGEEILSGYMSAIGQKLTYMSDKEIEELFSNEDLLESFIGGAVLGGLGGGGDAVKSAIKGVDPVSGLNKNEKAVVDKEYNSRLEEAEANGKLTNSQKNKLYDSVVKDMEKGYISTDTIEEVLGDRSSYDALSKEAEEFKTLYETESGKLSEKQKDRLAELKAKNEANPYKTAVEAEKAKHANNVFELVKNDRLVESYNEKGKRGQAFKADLSQYDEKQRATIQSAIDSGILNNTRKTHEFVDLVARISADKGVPFDFTNNKKLKESMFAIEGKTVNGYFDSKTKRIGININSSKALNTVVGHEVTHVLEGTKLYDALSEAVKNYEISKNGLESYNKKISELESLYKGVENASAERELVSDLVGEYLFTDSDFVNRLSTENRNVFEKIFDEIKYLCKVATAGSAEARQLEKVKKAFEDAYRGESKTQTGSSYSLGEIVTDDGTSYGIGVHLDSTLLDNLSPEERVGMVKEYVKELGGESFTAYDPSGNAVDITIAKSSDRFNNRNGKNVLVNKDLTNKFIGNEVKQEAIALVDELVSAAEFDRSSQAKYPHGWVDNNGKNDWEYWKTYIKDKNNAIWEATLNVANSANGVKILYDISPIKKVGQSIKLDTSLPTNNIPQTVDEVKNSFDAGDNITDAQNESGLDRKQEVDFSLSRDTEFSDNAIAKNNQAMLVDPDLMSQAKVVREQIAARMNQIKDKGLVGLPDDVEGSTFIANSSYDGTEENTTICPRSLASEAFVDAVSEYLGRPLTVEEQIYISQDLQGRSLTPECTYCYVATDRKAYRAFLGDYISQRDAVLEDYESGNWDVKTYTNEQIQKMTDEQKENSLYVKFLDGRKPTANMASRFNMWIKAAQNGTPLVQASDLANINKLMGDINSAFGAELKPQIVDAMKYAQSASWAKKRVNYVAYNGHILKWKQDRINKLNSHYGLRMYSFSDFHPAFVLENMQMITDASVRGLKMLGYTKDTDFVEIFAPSGMNINISTFGFETGGNVYENNIIGAEWEKAKALREQYPNVGITFVATNDTLVEWALAQEWIDVVIPYHLVRTGTEVAKAFGYTNYTSESADTKAKDWSKGDKKSIAPTEHNNDKSTYMDALEKNHLNPRFARFQDNPNYMKLVNECRQSASQSKPVQPVFNEDAAMKALAKLEANGYYQPIGGSVDRMYEIAAEVAEDMQSKVAPQMSLSNENEPQRRSRGNVYGEDIALAEDIGPVAQSATQNATVSGKESVAPVAISEKETTTNAKLVDDRLEKRRSNSQTELDHNRKLREETNQYYDDQIGNARALYDSKKNKNTKVATNLARRIERLERLKADNDAKFEKRIRDIETRLRKLDIEIDKDHTRQNEYERTVSKINRDLEYSKAELDKEFEQKRAQFANKSDYISNKASELYNELRSITKGVKASSQLGYLLDHGFEWSSIKSALINIKHTPDSVVNINSEAESVAREMLDDDFYDSQIDMEDGYQQRLDELETEAETKREEARVGYQRRAKNAEHTTFWERTIGDTSTWVDLPLGLAYKTKTLRRILRSVVKDANGKPDYQKADAIYDALEVKYDHNEAMLKQESAKLKEVFKKLNLTHAEDQYAQMLGELRYNPETSLSKEVVDDFYEKNKNKIDENKVNQAIDESRKLYDSLLTRVNEVLREQGIKEIPYRKGYFPHFTNPKQNWVQKLLNWKPIDNEIPTSIAGITETFNPQKSYQSFNKQRMGDRTDYSLYQGLDTYIHGALDWIYHIDDLQSRRALENLIRYTHSEEGVKKAIEKIRTDVTLDADEAQKRIESVLSEASNPLGGLVTELRSRTNTLANKKASMDRGMEEATNRKIYSTMTNLNNRINANHVVGSMSAALSNFIPITQSWVQVSPKYTVQGLRDFVRSTVRDDGMVAKSDFLTNRLMEEEKLVKSGWDKASDKISIVMSAVDGLASQTIWRSKYLQNLNEGMSEALAIKDADQFAKNLMAGRSRGNMPSIFEAKNPIIKLFTSFQLEVANQYGYMFEDAPQDVQNKARLVKGYVAATIGAYAYNAFYSYLTGRDAALDPVGIVEDLLKDLLDDEEDDELDAILGFAENVAQEVPFIGGLLGGGRVPVSVAFPYADDTAPLESFAGDVKKGVEEGEWNSLIKEVMKPLWYLVLPMGGGQARKTAQGLSMFLGDHPVAGSYTDSGNMRFPVEATAGNVLQAAVFGQYANENARYYFDNDIAPMNEKQIKEYTSLDIPVKDYWEYRDTAQKLEKMAKEEDATRDTILQSKYLNSVGDELNDILKEEKKIQDDTKMTQDAKDAKIKDLEKRFEELSKEAYTSYTDIEYDTSYKAGETYASIGDRVYKPDDDGEWRKLTDEQVEKYTITKNADNPYYATNGSIHYRKDASGDWTKISDKQLERQKEVTQSLGITPAEYWSKTDISFIPMAGGEHEYAYESPENYAVAKVLGGYDNYTTYTKALSSIESDKDENGKSISGSRKNKVLAYINSLNADYYTKLILFKSEYTSYDDENVKIVEYLNSRKDISYAETVAILRKLGFLVDAKGNVTWD